MSNIPDVQALSDDVLDRTYDRGAILRGTEYAEHRRVTTLSAEPGKITGVVQGTEATPYVVTVKWMGNPGGITVSDSCSCPLGDGCKHCVALILAVRRSAAERSEPDWRRALAGVVSDHDTPAEVSPLALGIGLTETRRSSHTSKPAGTEVTIRPLRMGRKGRWIKSGVSWREVSSPYGYSSRELDSNHMSILRSMLAGSKDSRYHPGNGELPLSRFGPDVWSHLRLASDAGIQLVRDETGSGVVTISDTPAHAVVDLSAGAEGAVALTICFEHRGQPVVPSPGISGTLGAPPHGLFVLDGEDLILIPLDRPLHGDLAKLVGSVPLVVPADDVDEMIDEYQPRLAQLARIASSDGSVAVSAPEFDGLSATVRRDEVDSAAIEWSVRYRRGDRVSTHRLNHPGSTGRDRAAESAALTALDLVAHLPDGLTDPGGRPIDRSLRGHDAVVLLTATVPWLRDNGVTVDVSGDVPQLREATEDPLISLAVTDPDSGDPDRNDWFDLAVEVSVDGETIEFARLFSALSNDEELLVLESGTWLRLERPEFAKLRALIDEARGLADHKGSSTLRINRFQSSWWDELTGLGVVEHQSARWLSSVSRLRELSAPERVEPSDSLTASLRPYQREGLDWLAFLYQHRLGGILADDMGLGKTVQTLALFLHVLDRSPDARFLVVAPTSVVENWHREATQFAPGVAVQTVRETEVRRGTSLGEEIGDARIVVTSYALFRIEFDHYRELDWELLVLDEAQFVKNHRGKTYQCVRRLDAEVKLAITGTPLENSLMDLWSLLSITAPGLYPDPTRFSEVYRVPIESGSAPELLATLRRRIAPLMRRRTKDEVLTELPPKTELTIEVELSRRHARIYQTQLQRQRQKVLGLADDLQKNRFEILKSLTLLRQLSLDPALVDPEHEEVGSAKLDQLLTDLTEVVAEGHRALVFSQFTRYLARVRTRLEAAGIDYAYLDGSTRNRDAAISAFKDGQVPVFVISLKAGGVGLNLTEADYCFVLDPWWNPAVETQAVDRTHRIGQRNPVMVYRYVSSGTIEEKVMELKARKAALFDSVMDSDGALSGSLSEDDIRGLLDLPT